MGRYISKTITIVAVIFGIWFVGYKFYDEDGIEEVPVKIIERSSMLSMMIETKANSGKYEMTTVSNWPTDDYIFNKTLSKCENGGTLSWDDTNKKVMFEGNNVDKCYVYFDKVQKKLSNYIKSLYTGVQGENNIYYHDSTLENGANDNSYRYAGSSKTTNNFICFGYDSTDGTCPTDYLYRIIGVFDDQVKLIKYDYAKSDILGTNGEYASVYSSTGNKGYPKGTNMPSRIGAYYWNSDTGTNTWSESKLNTINLNTFYLNEIGNIWASKIATHTWKVGGNTWANIGTVVASIAYQNELISPSVSSTYDSKIGLMYLSDFAYAAPSNAWTIPLFANNFNDYRLSSVAGVNWLYMGLWEWMITPRTDNNNLVFHADNEGNIYSNRVNYLKNAIRPSFYLDNNAVLESGNGSKTTPYILYINQDK